MVHSGFLWMSAIAQISPLADLSGLLRDALAWIDGLGPMGAIAFIGLYIVATVAFLPGSVLTLGAGVVFGLLAGTLYVLVGATLGAIAAFWVGRYLARDWVARKIAQNPRFRAIDEAIGREGLKIVVLTRLSPIFPFNLLNYSLGLTRVSLRDYCVGCVGMIPGTVLYVYLGSLAGSLATLGSGQTPSNPALEWTLRVVGFLATLGVTLYVTRLARQALQTKISETPDA